MPPKSSIPSALRATHKSRTPRDANLITRALAALQPRLRRTDVALHPASVLSFLRLQSANLPHEVFGVMFLDNANRLIAYEPMFRGTLTHTVVHPREVIKRALALNAASVILHHNHPGGSCRPSDADIALTSAVQAALSIVEVAVLDHVVTSDADAFSMAAHGLLATARPYSTSSTE